MQYIVEEFNRYGWKQQPTSTEHYGYESSHTQQNNQIHTHNNRQLNQVTHKYTFTRIQENNVQEYFTIEKVEFDKDFIKLKLSFPLKDTNEYNCAVYIENDYNCLYDYITEKLEYLE